jgi:integrase
LSIHLLPFFAKHRLDQITVQEVDRYRQHKVREGRIGARTINKTLTRLAQVLEVALEYELIARNPAAGRRRRLKVGRPRPVHLDSASQIVALLDAATELDGRETARTDGRRAVVATLAFAGLRASELADLRWRDVDLAAGRIYVGRSKTDAGMREVDLLPMLRDELLQHRLSADSPEPDDRVFTTARGGARDRNNIGLRVMRPVVARADELLAERGEHPLLEGVTAHKLRHTFASILIALGRDPAYVMAQLGHADPGFTLRVYTHAMRRGDGEREALRALVEGGEWAPMGTNAAEPTSDPGTPAGGRPAETRTTSGDPAMPPGGFEPPPPGLGNLCSIP